MENYFFVLEQNFENSVKDLKDGVSLSYEEEDHRLVCSKIVDGADPVRIKVMVVTDGSCYGVLCLFLNDVLDPLPGVMRGENPISVHLTLTCGSPNYDLCG